MGRGRRPARSAVPVGPTKTPCALALAAAGLTLGEGRARGGAARPDRFRIGERLSRTLRPSGANRDPATGKPSKAASDSFCIEKSPLSGPGESPVGFSSLKNTAGLSLNSAAPPPLRECSVTCGVKNKLGKENELFDVHYFISKDVIIIAFIALNILTANIGGSAYGNILEKFWVFVGVGRKVLVKPLG